MSDALKKYIYFLLRNKKYFELFSVSSLTYLLICIVVYLVVLFFHPSTLTLALSTGYLCLFFGAHFVMLFRILGEHFTPNLLYCLRYYRFSDYDLCCLGLLLVASHIALFALAVFFILFPLVGLLAALCITLMAFFLLVVSTVFITHRTVTIANRAKCDVRNKCKRNRRALNIGINASSRFNNIYKAYIYKDIKTARKTALFLELPVSLILSYGIFFAGFLLPGIFAVTSYLAYLILLFQVLVICVEAEFSPIAKHQVLRYRISDVQLWRMKMCLLYCCSAALFITHVISILLFSDAAVLLVLLDVISLLAVLFSLYCTSWMFLWCLRRWNRLYPLAELALFVVGAVAPLSLGLKMAAKLKTIDSEVP